MGKAIYVKQPEVLFGNMNNLQHALSLCGIEKEIVL